MNTRFFNKLGLMTVMGLTMIACSQNEDATDNLTSNIGEDGLYHYTMTLNCTTAGFEGEGVTRAVTYDQWNDGATLYVRFLSGSSYVTGTATYNKTANVWDVSAPSTLATTASDTNCEVYYFVNPEGTSTSAVTMSEKTACFFTTAATYKQPTANAISLTATLQPMTWRLRFKGTSGTSITLPGSDNDIAYYSSLDLGSGKFAGPAQKDIMLTVGSDGYTPYIYGTFKNNSGDNKITVSNNELYTRNLAASKLSVGESAFLAIPPTTGWEKIEMPIDPNATIMVNDFVAFTDGMVTDFTFGATASTFDYTVFTKTGAEALSDDSIANRAYTDPYTMEQAEYNFKSTNSDWYKTDTEYYLIAVAKNAAGKRGPVLRYKFKTLADNLPYAEISNIKAASTTKWSYDIALKNNAKAYYLGTSTNESTFSSDWHWFAYNVHYWATSNQIETHDWSSVATTLSSGTCSVITVCTWGVDANNNIGGCNVAYGNTSSSARPLILSSDVLDKGMISKDEMQKMRESITVCEVNE